MVLELNRAPATILDAACMQRRYDAVRRCTEELCAPLAIEDYLLQAMPDASPAKWHLAHTAWFFETFVLRVYRPDYRPFHTGFETLFNSYYNALGPRWPRAQRGLLSRPTVDQVYAYRHYVDAGVAPLFASANRDVLQQAAAVIELGLHHEQQHQELILTDLNYGLSVNPLDPIYRSPDLEEGTRRPASGWIDYPGGLVTVGHAGREFAFDNESPRHRVFLQPFRFARRLATNAEYAEFIGDKGYDRPELWLSDGWATRQAQDWHAPLYWRWLDDGWHARTLAGTHPVDLEAPVGHVSFYEADAFARWAGARLPTEFEWEAAAARAPLAGHFLEARHLSPSAFLSADDTGPIAQLYGHLWQWTASPYLAYPGYRPAAGALGEYNGKFMCNQMVLRGASCATPRSHARLTYRNFFPSSARWQFAGIRLAGDLS